MNQSLSWPSESGQAPPSLARRGMRAGGNDAAASRLARNRSRIEAIGISPRGLAGSLIFDQLLPALCREIVLAEDQAAIAPVDHGERFSDQGSEGHLGGNPLQGV